MTAIRLFGDWDRLDRMLARARRDIEPAMDAALQAVSEMAAEDVRRGVQSQAPGGQKLRPPARSTILARRMSGISGNKALIRTGKIYGSVVARPAGRLRYRVGIPDPGDARVAAMHERGAGPFFVRLTPKMMAFLFASGIIVPRRRGGRTEGGRPGYAVIRIPARPVFKPMAAAIGRRPQRYMRAARRAFNAKMGYALGR